MVNEGIMERKIFRIAKGSEWDEVLGGSSLLIEFAEYLQENYFDDRGFMTKNLRVIVEEADECCTGGETNEK